MAFCSQCGKPIEDGTTICAECAAKQAQPIDAQAAPQESASFDPADISSNKAMAILAYIGILVLIPLFAAKSSPYARYHTNQGLVLLIFDLAWGIVCGIINAILAVISVTVGLAVLAGVISTLLSIASLVFLVLMIYGIYNAATDKAKPLPVIGGITLLK